VYAAERVSYSLVRPLEGIIVPHFFPIPFPELYCKPPVRAPVVFEDERNGNLAKKLEYARVERFGLLPALSS